MSGSGGGSTFDRIVTFIEVRLGPGNWQISPSTEGFFNYFQSFGESNYVTSSNIIITRSDGKALAIDFSQDDPQHNYFSFDISENVIKFISSSGRNADGPFQ
jgi:hypothetical protein